MVIVIALNLPKMPAIMPTPPVKKSLPRQIDAPDQALIREFITNKTIPSISIDTAA